MLLAVVVAASAGLAPVELVAVSGALLMVITKVITPRSAVRALYWNVLFVLAGSVGLGAVVVSSGLADAIAGGHPHAGWWQPAHRRRARRRDGPHEQPS